MRAAVVQERIDKHPTLAYEHGGRWRSYSNNKFIKWVPDAYIDVDTLVWLTEPTSLTRPVVVETGDGNMLIATYDGNGWFSLHSGKRLQVNVTKWARIVWNAT